MTNLKQSGSFRDPSGFIFLKDDQIYRQINTIYKEDYDHLMDSGLYQILTDANLLIPHEESNLELASSSDAYKVIKPQRIPFISYPYEWCFSQLKAAALLTIAIQKIALEYGMSLKDASAYNIQFVGGAVVYIDTLSFERYQEGSAWVAYRQFCQHFLAPLALMSLKDIRFSQLCRIYLDGVPLDLASSILPKRSRFNFSLLSHIHLHAKSQKHFADITIDRDQAKLSRRSFLGLIDNLEAAINKMKWQPRDTEWGDYYEDTIYSDEDMRQKKQFVAEAINKINPDSVWDLGANTGYFSRVAGQKGIPTIAFDIDPAAVEKNYLECIAASEANLLPLLIDLTNPSPSIGWQNKERMSLMDRGPVDAALALALIHHLAISNNVPLHDIADFFHLICHFLIIEFVPKSDPQVQKLLSTREDVFPDYTQAVFEEKFNDFFEIKFSMPVGKSKRILYHMINKYQ
ncbi:hypothetical protein D1BOALGB6SA_9877 [Olavius sp. associated proteobacterium Delta 1]|nr:hypothetical protein D1BOALGB6SA_9877 [Olavius sp. associated proteobacterium Delta 1]